jgi:hypothetical protein
LPNHPPTESTDLARATINGADTITVQLVQPANMPTIERTLHPAVVRIVWPEAPTIVDPNQFGDTASAIVKLFSEAHVTLARIKGRRYL